jgi:LmbE family N-acetylglucosaminyl deacetylase|tara:strand:+ start:2873 stop:3514 length:642 start_codon:yes stop_codon:yes gene_type:complete
MKVLICVAHPDDEVLGCGGAIASYVENGDEVISVIFTYGENSSLFKSPKALAEARIKESVDAGKILGANKLHFLGLPDSTLSKEIQDSKIQKKVGALLKKYDPDIILTHSIDDAHPAHISVAKLIKQKAKRRKLKARIYTFNNWSPIRSKNVNKPKLVIDTSKHLNKKRRALKVFKTQDPTVGWKYNVALALLKDYWNGVRHGKLTAEVFYKW